MINYQQEINSTANESESVEGFSPDIQKSAREEQEQESLREEVMFLRKMITSLKNKEVHNSYM